MASFDWHISDVLSSSVTKYSDTISSPIGPFRMGLTGACNVFVTPVLSDEEYRRECDKRENSVSNNGGEGFGGDVASHVGDDDDIPAWSRAASLTFTVYEADQEILSNQVKDIFTRVYSKRSVDFTFTDRHPRYVFKDAFGAIDMKNIRNGSNDSGTFYRDHSFVSLSINTSKAKRSTVGCIKRGDDAGDKKGNSKVSTVGRGKVPFCGLVNQGATCYLNSLLQSLFHLPVFRKLVMSLLPSYDMAPLIKELRLLFGAMQTGHVVGLRAVKTTGLTTAFGWNSGEVYAQHDIVEMYQLLLDKIEERLKQQLEGSEKPLHELFEVRTATLITNKEQDYRKEVEEVTNTLPVPIAGMKSLQMSLSELLKPTILDKDSGNGVTINGVKHSVENRTAIKVLPPVLVIQMRRFDFNMKTFQTYKVSDAVSIPEELDMNEIARKASPEAHKNVNLGKYKLYSVVIHSGGTGGGHYTACIDVREFESTKPTTTNIETNVNQVSAVAKKSVSKTAAVEDSGKNEEVDVVEVVQGGTQKRESDETPNDTTAKNDQPGDNETVSESSVPPPSYAASGTQTNPKVVRRNSGRGSKGNIYSIPCPSVSQNYEGGSNMFFFNDSQVSLVPKKSALRNLSKNVSPDASQVFASGNATPYLLFYVREGFIPNVFAKIHDTDIPDDLIPAQETPKQQTDKRTTQGIRHEEQSTQVVAPVAERAVSYGVPVRFSTPTMLIRRVFGLNCEFDRLPCFPPGVMTRYKAGGDEPGQLDEDTKTLLLNPTHSLKDEITKISTSLGLSGVKRITKSKRNVFRAADTRRKQRDSRFLTQSEMLMPIEELTARALCPEFVLLQEPASVHVMLYSPVDVSVYLSSERSESSDDMHALPGAGSNLSAVIRQLSTILLSRVMFVGSLSPDIAGKCRQNGIFSLIRSSLRDGSCADGVTLLTARVKRHNGSLSTFDMGSSKRGSNKKGKDRERTDNSSNFLLPNFVALEMVENETMLADGDMLIVQLVRVGGQAEGAKVVEGEKEKEEGISFNVELAPPTLAEAKKEFKEVSELYLPRRSDGERPREPKESNMFFGLLKSFQYGAEGPIDVSVHFKTFFSCCFISSLIFSARLGEETNVASTKQRYNYGGIDPADNAFSNHNNNRALVAPGSTESVLFRLAVPNPPVFSFKSDMSRETFKRVFAAFFSASQNITWMQTHVGTFALSEYYAEQPEGVVEESRSVQLCMLKTQNVELLRRWIDAKAMDPLGLEGKSRVLLFCNSCLVSGGCVGDYNSMNGDLYTIGVRLLRDEYVLGFNTETVSQLGTTGLTLLRDRGSVEGEKEGDPERYVEGFPMRFRRFKGCDPDAQANGQGQLDVEWVDGGFYTNFLEQLSSRVFNKLECCVPVSDQAGNNDGVMSTGETGGDISVTGDGLAETLNGNDTTKEVSDTKPESCQPSPLGFDDFYVLGLSGNTCIASGGDVFPNSNMRSNISSIVVGTKVMIHPSTPIKVGKADGGGAEKGGQIGEAEQKPTDLLDFVVYQVEGKTAKTNFISGELETGFVSAPVVVRVRESQLNIVTAGDVRHSIESECNGVPFAIPHLALATFRGEIIHIFNNKSRPFNTLLSCARSGSGSVPSCALCVFFPEGRPNPERKGTDDSGYIGADTTRFGRSKELHIN